MSSRLRALLATIVAGALVGGGLISGCAGVPQSTAPTSTPTAMVDSRPLGQLDILQKPRDYVGPSTAVLASDTITPVDPVLPQSFPATVTSHDLSGDVAVTVTSADRVIALDIAGSIASTVVGLGYGDLLIARDISTTLPQLADLPIVTTGGHSINSEAVLAQRPDLIITDGTIGPVDVLLQLRDAGVNVVFVNAEPSFTGASDLARDVSAALGAPAAGDELGARLTTEITDKVAEIAAITPTADGDRLRMAFLYLRGASGIYYFFGEGSGADSLITALGGIDVAGEIGWSGMKPMTDEALIAANPDLILVMTDGLASVGGVDGLLEAKPAVALTTAGTHRRVVDMADGQILSFGPRTPAVLDALARAIYAPR
jgi:iron complex transport system substrate-binding protein